MRVEPAALVYHHHRLTPLGFWRQHLSYGRGAYLFHQNRSKAGLVRPEPPTFYWRLLARAFSPADRRRALRILSLLVLSQALNVAGFLIEAAITRNSRREI